MNNPIIEQVTTCCVTLATCVPICVVKTALSIANVVLANMALVMAIISGTKNSDWKRISDDGYMFFSNPGFMTGVTFTACWTTVVSLFGCVVSSFWTDRRALLVYTAMVFVNLIIHVTQMSIVIQTDVSTTEVEDQMREMLSKYKEASHKPQSAFFDFYFQTRKCCGIGNFTADFTNLDFKQMDLRKEAGIALNSSIPFTCCKGYDWRSTTVNFEKIRDCLENPSEVNANIQGCKNAIKKFSEFVKSLATIMLSVGIALEIFMLFGAVVLYLIELPHEG